MGIAHVPARAQLWAWLYAVNWGCVVDGLGWPLIHFWSLAIEEHFYLIWPFVIWGCRRGTAVGVCIACILLSTAIREVQVFKGVAPSVFWMLDSTHFDSLALGGLIALAARGPRGSFILVRPAKYVAVFSAMTLGFVVGRLGEMSHMSPDFQAYGVTPLVALFGSALILVAHTPRSSPLGLLFNSAPMRFFGKYSYGLYVWHGVLMAQFDLGSRSRNTRPPSAPSRWRSSCTPPSRPR
jgi:peptidoglycan/LPS O-acetylase OafA/YrhL